VHFVGFQLIYIRKCTVKHALTFSLVCVSSDNIHNDSYSVVHHAPYHSLLSGLLCCVHHLPFTDECDNVIPLNIHPFGPKWKTLFHCGLLNLMVYQPEHKSGSVKSVQ
jgi:hypothetical protein